MHVNESCHIWMSHVTCEWVMSHMNESCHIWMSHVTYEWVTSHIWMTAAGTHIAHKYIHTYTHTHQTNKLVPRRHFCAEETFLCQSALLHNIIFFAWLFCKWTLHTWWHKQQKAYKAVLICSGKEKNLCLKHKLLAHLYVTWLIYMWHGSFICDMAHSHETWLIHVLHFLGNENNLCFNFDGQPGRGGREWAAFAHE